MRLFKYHYEQDRGSKERWNWLALTLLIAGIFAMLLGGIGIYKATRPDTNPLPESIRPDLPFSPLVIPANEKEYTTSNYKLTAAEDKTEILSYEIRTPSGASVAVSQYTQPAQFTEIPEYKDRFLTNVAQQYDTAQTSNGTIYLGRLSKQNNRQLGIMLERGLLVLMSPDKDMDKSQWRQLGDQLDLQKTSR